MYANFEHYKTFYYVAKYQNFTKAANALLTSQPSVTCCIRNLESTLGCKLFIRSSKGVRLTEEGELLYSYIAPSCENIAEGELALKKAVGMKNKSVAIGTTQLAMNYFLLPRLQRFQETYPEIYLKIYCTTTPQTMQNLQAGKIDLAIVSTPFTLSEGFENITVTEFDSVLVAGPKFHMLKGKKVSMEELLGYPLISFNQDTGSYLFYQEMFYRAGVSPKADIEVPTMDMILPLAEKNLGLGFVPEFSAEEAIQNDRVFAVELQETIPRRKICMVSDKQRPMGLEVKQLCSMLQELGE